MKKIYIVHGWSYSLDKWQKTVELMKNAGFSPVLLQVPGLTEDSEKSWTINAYVSWLGKQLVSENQPITLLGHSNGGRIVLNYTLANPSRVGQMVLLDSAGVYHNGLLIQLKRAIFKTLAKVGKKFRDVPQLRNILYKLARETDYRDAPQNMRKTMANMISSDRQLDVSAIETQTAIIWGRQDTVTPLEDARVLHKKIKSSKLYIIDEARHSPHDTHPKELVEILKEVIL